MKKIIAQAAVAGTISAVMIQGLVAYAPAWEGSIFPVAEASGDTVLEKIEPQLSSIGGTMVKHRSCTLQSIKATTTDQLGNVALVTLDVQESVRLRPTGEFGWGTWYLRLPIWQTGLTLQITTRHRCHPFWPTETVFYETRLP